MIELEFMDRGLPAAMDVAIFVLTGFLPRTFIYELHSLPGACVRAPTPFIAIITISNLTGLKRNN